MLGLEVEVAAREQEVTLHLYGQGGGQGANAVQLRHCIAVGSRSVQPFSTKETSSIQPF